MKITCPRQPLQEAFQTAAAVAPARSPKPILQNVRLDATDKSGLLMATDLEVGVRVELTALEIEQPGSVLLPVQRFGMILRESSDEQLHLESSESGTLVRGDRSQITLLAEDPAEFPQVASFDEQSYHEVPARLLRELIRRTLFATDNESSRYALGGVLLELEPEKITAVGTDGRRLAKMEGPAVSVGEHGSGEHSTIVPARSLQLIERAVSDADAEIKIAARANDLLVRSPRATIYTRLVEGRFPRWRDVLPQDRPGAQKISLTVGPLLATIRQAAVVATDESRGIDCTFAAGNLVLQARTADAGQSRIELPIGYDGPQIDITLDHRFVAEYLRVLEPDRNVELELLDSDGPAVFRTDDGYAYVVMPLARDRAGQPS